MGQSSRGSLQCDSSDEEDCKNNVREDSGEVNNFPRGSNTLQGKIKHYIQIYCFLRAYLQFPIYAWFKSNTWCSFCTKSKFKSDLFGPSAIELEERIFLSSMG